MSETPDEQLKDFIAKFSPAMGKLIRECRAAMRTRFQTANEHPSDCVVSLAANAKGLGLNFYRGAAPPDPHRL